MAIVVSEITALKAHMPKEKSIFFAVDMVSISSVGNDLASGYV